MKIAYMLLIHKNYKQVNMLINVLDDPDIDLHIHVDKKSEDLYHKLKEEYKNKKNIYILDERFSVNRRGFSMVEATLSLMKSVSKKEYSYVSLISGQCFPIAPMQEIKAFLSDNYGKEYIEGNEIGSNFWRIKCYNLFSDKSNNMRLYIRIIDKVLRQIQILFVRRKNLIGFDLYKGSQWFTITYDCLKYILFYLEDNPKYIEDFKFSYCPDESFFHTMVMNSDFKKNRINTDLMEIDWDNPVNGSPRNYGVKDFELLKNSENLFARKFDTEFDADILNKINH